MLESSVCEEQTELYNLNYIEEKVGEIPTEKINEVVFTKDWKNVNDKNREGLS